MNLTELAREIHEQNVHVGWWDEWPVKTDRHKTAMMLVVSEIAEAMEGHRKNLMDDHLPQYRMFDVELADALIRLLDLAGAYDMILDNYAKQVDLEKRRWKNVIPWSNLKVPEQLYRIVQRMSSQREEPHQNVFQGVVSIIIVAEINDIDILPIVDAKREYNAKRADHKRQNRNAENGKKY